MGASNRIVRSLRRTLVQALPNVLLIAILNFFLLRQAPGDAADVLAGESGSATEETMAALRHHFGLDLPVLRQLFAYLDNLAHFSLGQSPRFDMPVADLIAQRLPNTLLLMAAAMGCALLLGVVVGVLMAAFVGKWPDRLTSILTMALYSIPSFWIGLMLIVLFSVKLSWLPSGGAETIGAELTGYAALVDRLRHMILPASALAGFYVAIYARLVRGAMLETQAQDYVRTAVAKGLSPLRIKIRHVLRNALLPISTMAGIHIGGLLGGSVVVETVFSWPGLGRLAYESVLGRDFNVLLGILLLSSLLVVAINAAIDLFQAWADPRIEVR
jgi:peptide/nickel transport system permease protein